MNGMWLKQASCVSDSVRRWAPLTLAHNTWMISSTFKQRCSTRQSWSINQVPSRARLCSKLSSCREAPDRKVLRSSIQTPSCDRRLKWSAIRINVCRGLTLSIIILLKLEIMEQVWVKQVIIVKVVIVVLANRLNSCTSKKKWNQLFIILKTWGMSSNFSWKTFSIRNNSKLTNSFNSLCKVWSIVANRTPWWVKEWRVRVE